MEYDFEIYQLSQKFFADYPESQFPELMQKIGRPYSCLLIDSRDGYFICIPYRSSIGHKNSYMFKNSQRSRKTKSGLDYSKIAIISNTDYFDEMPAIVDKDEYNETVKHMPILRSSRSLIPIPSCTHLRRNSGVLISRSVSSSLAQLQNFLFSFISPVPSE